MSRHHCPLNRKKIKKKEVALRNVSVHLIMSTDTTLWFILQLWIFFSLGKTPDVTREMSLDQDRKLKRPNYLYILHDLKKKSIRFQHFQLERNS